MAASDTAIRALGLSLAPLSSGRALRLAVWSLSKGLKDGIGEAALEYASGRASAVPAVLVPFDHFSLAGGCQRAWVRAMRCRAAFSWRFPVRLNRCPGLLM